VSLERQPAFGGYIQFRFVYEREIVMTELGDEQFENRKPNRQRVSPQQRKLIEGVARGKTITQAALDAGYSPRGAAQAGHRALQNLRKRSPQIVDRLEYPLEKLIVDVLVPLLEAKKTHFFSYKGIVKDKREVPDHNIQLRAMVETLKLHGVYPTQTRNREPSQAQVSGPYFTIAYNPHAKKQVAPQESQNEKTGPNDEFENDNLKLIRNGTRT
jgi:hypothetical protein